MKTKERKAPKVHKPNTIQALAKIKDQFVKPTEKPEEPRPGPITVADLRTATLERAGFGPESVQRAVAVIHEVMDECDEPHARLVAAKMAFQLANLFTSKNVKVEQKTEVIVTMKPWAQARVIDAESVSAPAEVAEVA